VRDDRVSAGTVREVTVLVDDARWVWRGKRWAHLVSDDSYDELHEFARRLGKRRLGFQGDHYDIDEGDRTRALDLGAMATGSRELVRRLRESGLRNRSDKPAWEKIAHWPSGTELIGLEPELAAVVRALELDTEAAQAGLYRGNVDMVLLLDLPPGVEIRTRLRPAWIGEPRSDGWRSVEIFVSH
jgi:uncharacterized protein DUF4031